MTVQLAAKPAARRIGGALTRLGLVALLTCAILLFLGVASASASHNRFSNLSWTQVGTTGDVDFRGRIAQRCTFNFSSCPAPGATFLSSTWTTGDGGSLPGSYVVVSSNAAEDWMLGELYEGSNTADRNVRHTYATLGQFTAVLQDCCTIFELNNNASGNYSNQSYIDLAGDDESAITSIPPIVDVGNVGVQTYNIPAVDSGGETLRWRLATADEACNFFGSTCSDPQPPGLTINSTTGQVTWDTTSVAEGLWFTSAVIESLNGAGAVVATTQVTYLIRVSDRAANAAPEWNSPPTPADGTEYTVPVGTNLTVNLEADDADAGDTVTIDNLGIPAGATFTDTPGNPATGQFSWTPASGQEGDYLVTFTATDDKSPPAQAPSRTITIHVVEDEEGIDGRMVGNATRGGAQYASIIDCDAALANANNRPFTIRWSGKTFRLIDVTTVNCTDDPSFTPSPPPATMDFDTQTGTGAGSVNGAAGYTLEWTLTDHGAPNPNDEARLKITKDSDGSTVLDIPRGMVASGQNYALPPS